MLTRLYIASVALILGLTAFLKTLTLLFFPGGLDRSDPFLYWFSAGQTMLVAILLEALVFVMLICPWTTRRKLLLIAWIGSLFALYRMGLVAIGYNDSCNCLGRVYSWMTGAQIFAGKYFAVGAILYMILPTYAEIFSKCPGSAKAESSALVKE